MAGGSMRTPLGRVLGLGSAHSGTEHFWRQRVTGLANLFLAIGVVVIVAMTAGRPYPEVVAILSSPVAAVILFLLVVSVAVHMRLGMQVVIEDYVHGDGARIAALVANTFFSVTVGAVAAFAILKLAFGGA
mgnify:FL=1